ncbi:hypothetical protein N665_0264s0036 [Sinapis alba]|nr:hypothetical protein N665_0264s0036 [Sinapis alba]
MDTFTTQKTKSRKIKRLAKKPRAQIILDLFYRVIEIILVIVTVAKLCYQLVITLHDSGVTAAILANRNLAFVVANAIVVALIAKSGILLNQEVVTKTKRNAFYEEFVQESSRRDEVSRAEMRNRGKQSEAEEETQSITETISKQSIPGKGETRSKPEKVTKQRTSVKRVKQSIVEHQETTVKKMEKQKRQSQSYQRSRSENLEGLERSSCGRLRRSETDASSDRFDSEDELRFKIESFIARQRRNQNDD